MSVSNRRFPASQEALSNGEELSFGPFALSREGITTLGIDSLNVSDLTENDLPLDVGVHQARTK